MKYFKMKELARCFRENGNRCQGCPLRQRAQILPNDAEDNIRALVEEVLDPARDKLGKPIKVNSGYRCPKHNLEVGGAVNSQHMKGEAADIAPVDSGKVTDDSLKRLKQIIIENGKFDQLIDYGTFLHVSWKRNGVNRKQTLRKFVDNR